MTSKECWKGNILMIVDGATNKITNGLTQQLENKSAGLNSGGG